MSNESESGLSWFLATRMILGMVVMLMFTVDGAVLAVQAPVAGAGAPIFEQLSSAWRTLYPLARGMFLGLLAFGVIVNGPQLARIGFRKVMAHV